MARIPTELVERWRTPEGDRLRDHILTAIKEGRPLSSVPGLPRHDGRWDLRGFAFPEMLMWKDAVWSDVDLSWADLKSQLWVHCQFQRVRLDGADLRRTVDYGCQFEAVESNAGDWRGYGFGLAAWKTLWNRHIGESHYRHCHFERVRCQLAAFGSPWFEDCQFLGCTFGTTDCEGSHFIRCRFTGKLSDVRFRGRSPDPERAASEPNPMRDVDFREATLSYCNFTDGCDLSRTWLPQDGKHFLVANPAAALDSALEELDSWPPAWQDIARKDIGIWRRFVDGQRHALFNLDDKVKFAKDFLGDAAEAALLAEKLLALYHAQLPPQPVE